MATINAVGSTSVPFVITPVTPGTIFLIDLLPGFVISSAQVRVETSFDGTPSFQLGIASNLDLILQSSEVKMGTIGRYLSSAHHRFSTSEVLTVTFSGGGATVGLARLIVQITRET